MHGWCSAHRTQPAPRSSYVCHATAAVGLSLSTVSLSGAALLTSALQILRKGASRRQQPNAHLQTSHQHPVRNLSRSLWSGSYAGSGTGYGPECHTDLPSAHFRDG